MHRGRLVAALLATSVTAGSVALAAPATAAEPVGVVHVSVGAIGSHVFSDGVSADGRYAFFETAAAGVTPGDDDGMTDVYRRDLHARETVRVTVPSGGDLYGGGNEAVASPTGDIVVFRSSRREGMTSGTPRSELFLRDLTRGTTVRLTPRDDGDAGYQAPVFADDGRAFVYVSTRNAGKDAAGQQVWASSVLRVDVASGTQTVIVETGPQRYGARAGITPDGDGVTIVTDAALVGADLNQVSDVYLWQAGQLELVSAGRTGAAGNATSWGPRPSADGARVLFRSVATDLTPHAAASGLYVRDLRTGQTELASVDEMGLPFEHWDDTAIDRAGTSVTFIADHRGYSYFQVYRRDLERDTTTLVSARPDGGRPNRPSNQLAMSTDGTRVAFVSAATDLAGARGNGSSEGVHVWDAATGSTTAFCCDFSFNVRRLAASYDAATIVFDGVTSWGGQNGAWAIRPEDHQASLTAADVAEPESGTAHIVIERSGATDRQASLLWRTVTGSAADDDFTAASGTLVFEPGASAATIEVALTNDPVHEADETFSVELSSPNGALLLTPSVEVRILDDDPPPVVTLQPGRVIETDTRSTAFVHATLTGASALAFAVEYQTTWVAPDSALAEIDFEPFVDSVIVPAGATGVDLPVRIIGDALPEIDERFTVELLSVSDGAIGGSGAAKVTIVDDDLPLPRAGRI